MTLPSSGDPVDGPPEPPHPPARADEATEAQLEEVTGRLLRDAAAAGVDPAVVHDAVERAAKDYTGAPVRSFVGVLVERTVRAELALRVSRDPDDG